MTEKAAGENLEAAPESPEQTFLHKLAAQLREVEAPGAAPLRILAGTEVTGLYLKKYEAWFERARYTYLELSAASAQHSQGAEWLLDNYYLLKEALQLIEQDLPLRTQRKLPKLTQPPYRGYPRSAFLSRSMLAELGYDLEVDRLVELLRHFEESQPLEMRELWSLPLYLRLGLLEQLGQVLIAELNPADPPDLPFVPPLPDELCPSLSFEEGTQSQQLVEGIANCISSLRRIGEIDWTEIFEKLSLVEGLLRQDPPGIYSGMDFKTRDLYRSAVEKLANGSGKTELSITRSLMELSRGVGESSLQAGHVGIFLFGDGRKRLEEAVGYKPSFRERLKDWLKARAEPLYLGVIVVGALILIGLVGWVLLRQPLQEGSGALQILLLAAMLLSLTPLSLMFVNDLLNTLLTTYMNPRVLPKMAYKTRIPAEFQTLVVIPGLISSKADVDNLVHQLELHYLGNPLEGIKFAILSDFADADEENRPEDEELLQYASAAIVALEKRAPAYLQRSGGALPGKRFFLLHRRRLWNPSQGTWMGWERKRGKLDELNRFLRGDDETTFLKEFANEQTRSELGYIRFVVTVDSDTILPPGSVVRMAGTLSHPLNQVQTDPLTGRIHAGYSILQPRVDINPRSANQTWFTRIFAGDTGLDLYTHAVSDVYQDLFGEGIYVGKGIYDVDAMLKFVEKSIPENSLLSHDLLEGILGRAGLVSDISLVEDYPATYYEQSVRQRRWIRGDWQLLPWLLRPGKYGVKFSVINRWKILHNLLRSLLSPALLTNFLLGILFFPRLTWLWIAVLLVSFGTPLVTALLKKLVQSFKVNKQEALWPSLWPVFLRWVFSIAFLPYEAYYALDAILITLARVYITHKKLLSWTTFERTSALFSNSATQNRTWLRLSLSALLAVAVAFLAQITTIPGVESSILLRMPIVGVIILWLLSSPLVRFVNLPLPSPQNLTPYQHPEELRLISRRTWSFFEQFVGPQDHWLPPDHYQETPVPIVAHHTSPSNIGLYLTAAIAAYDMGYLDQQSLAARLQATIETLDQLERYRGHFLNWYNTQTLEPLKPRYVSTVDSGNLAISLIILRSTSQELPDQPVLRWKRWEGYLDNLAALGHILKEINSQQANKKIDAALEQISVTESLILATKEHPYEWYRLFQQVSGPRWQQLLVVLAEITSDLPANIALDTLDQLQMVLRLMTQHHSIIDQITGEMVPWQARMEEPAALLLRKENPPWFSRLMSVLDPLPSVRKIPEITAQAASLIEARLAELAVASPGLDTTLRGERDWLSRLGGQLSKAEEIAVKLTENFGWLAEKANQLYDAMNFGFLYSDERKVFHLGFNLETGQLDQNYYDLLASEARIASVIAIAKGDVPVEHWMQLHRPITRADGGISLLSWSATMFEYLMPTLYLRSYPNTLLHMSAATAVHVQQVYAGNKGVPWGISESGFRQFDANQNYQYRAFGIPGLGFKHGLGEDLVVAPYASLMALKWAPSEVEENVKALRSKGALGRYGFYEAIDFTHDHLNAGKPFEVVREYMSHHQGMILLAMDNYLFEDRMIERVHSDARIQSVELLLQEQIPAGVPLLKLEEEVLTSARAALANPVSIPSWPVAALSDLPKMHLLSNGEFSELISNRGSGSLSWKGTDLTRWQSDGVQDNWGSWLYIQDMALRDALGHPHTWSAAQQPFPTQAELMQVNFFPHMAVFHRTEAELISTMEVTVAAADPLEIRHVHLINNGNTRRHLRLTTYGEVILNQQAADARHPAFNKLSIEAEFIPDLSLQIIKRRGEEEPGHAVYLGHMLVIKPGQEQRNNHTEIANESDRRQFLGRERTYRNPLALESAEYLSGTSGATLDPIFSLGKEVFVAPHNTFEVAYLTFAASSREELLEIARRYSVWSRVIAVFHEADSASLRWLGAQKVNEEALHANLDLLSALLYPRSYLRADEKILSSNSLNQAGLWRFGISGDYPIFLLELQQGDDLDLLGDAIEGQNFLRSRGFPTELVVLNTEPSTYSSEMNALLLRKVQQQDAGQWLNQRSGIFIRSEDQMKAEERFLLRSAARVVLKGSAGSFASQLRAEPARPAELPHLAPLQPSRRTLPAPVVWEASAHENLRFYNGYGGFSADGREYLLQLTEGKTTPAPWVNVVGYPHFGFMISQSGSQTTWLLNSGENRLSPWSNDPVSDPSGEVLYLRDEESGDLWTPTPQPTPGPGEYLVRHGAGYTTFESESHGLKQEMTVFGSPEDPVKIVHLKIKNVEDYNRRLTATYYIEWVLGLTHADSGAFLIPGYHADYAMLTMRNPYHAEMGEHIAFLMANRTPYGFTTDRLGFIGPTGDLRAPEGLKRIGLSNRLEIGGDVCGALQLPLDIVAHGKDEFYFVVGEAKNLEEVYRLAQKYRDPSAIGEAFRRSGVFWDNLLDRLQVKTPDEATNLMLNRWWLYQTLSGRVWGRTGFYQSSGAFGFRDQLQDVLATLDVDENIARTQLIYAAHYQFEEGDVLHWWHPPTGRGVRTRISDNLVWLPYVASIYAERTGDMAIWEEQIPYLQAAPLQQGENDRYGLYPSTEHKFTLFDHCVRALRKGSTIGSHSLPLIGSGDWNDGFNKVGREGQGESIWLGWFLIDTLRRFARVCEQRGEEALAEEFRERAEAYVQAIQKVGWDGGWYLRAFYDDGSALGSHASAEGQIDAIAQSWAVMSAAGDEQRDRIAMESVWQRLVRADQGLSLLFTPPFESGPKNPGVIRNYPPGVRENGGQYTHAAVWTAWATAMLGEAGRAWQLYTMLNPIWQSDTPERAEQYRVEPYIEVADIYSQEPYLRRGGWSWYTGSAAWVYRLGMEELLGFHKRGDTLELSPLIPADWDGFTLTYRHRKWVYTIEVQNPEHTSSGVEAIFLDGVRLEGFTLPLEKENAPEGAAGHKVRVMLGTREAQPEAQRKPAE